MKCIYVLKTGTVINGVRYRCGMVVIEGSDQYNKIVKKVASQLKETYEPKAFGIHCDVEDIAARIKDLPLELRPKNGLSEDIDEAVARILADHLRPPEAPEYVLKERMTVYVAHSKAPGEEPKTDNKLTPVIHASSEDKAALALVAAELESKESEDVIVPKAKGRKPKG